MGLILAIETSCDETAAAVVNDGREILSNIIYSQVEIHKKYGGVVPEIASRKHLDTISQTVTEAMEVANVSFADFNAVAATNGPGLAGALLAGVSYAKALAFSVKKPIIGVHHIEGHICANFLARPDLAPPFICLVASGGHTSLVRVDGYAEYKLIGKTRDDACGEAFDKVARALGLGYPGGPAIDKISEDGGAVIDFPRANLGETYDFSFSGLKSAVINYMEKCERTGIFVNTADVAASFRKAVVGALTEKSVSACKAHGIKKFALCGGVACNSELRKETAASCESAGIEFYLPPAVLCTDNAAMIACRAHYDLIRGKFAGMSLNARPNWPVTE